MGQPAGSRTGWRWPWRIGTAALVFAAGTVSAGLTAVWSDLVAREVVGFTDLRWLVGAGPLAFGVLVVAGALAGDALGHVRVQFVGAVLFAAASVLAALAGGRAPLLAAVTVQGIGAALGVPQAVGYARAHLPAVE